MNFAQLMQQLESMLEVEHLTPNDKGEYVVEFDGWLEVRLRQLDRSTVLMQSTVGREPDDELAAQRYLERVLRFSLLHVRQAAEVAALEPKSCELHLYRTLELDALTPHGLHEVLEHFANAAEHWHGLLTEDRSHSGPVMMLMP